VRRGGKQRG